MKYFKMILSEDKQPFPTLKWYPEDNPERYIIEPIGEIYVLYGEDQHTTDLVYNHPDGIIVVHDERIVKEGYISKASVYCLKQKEDLKLLLIESKLDAAER